MLCRLFVQKGEKTRKEMRPRLMMTNGARNRQNEAGSKKRVNVILYPFSSAERCSRNRCVPKARQTLSIMSSSCVRRPASSFLSRPLLCCDSITSPSVLDRASHPSFMNLPRSFMESTPIRSPSITAPSQPITPLQPESQPHTPPLPRPQGEHPSSPPAPASPDKSPPSSPPPVSTPPHKSET